MEWKRLGLAVMAAGLVGVGVTGASTLDDGYEPSKLLGLMWMMWTPINLYPVTTDLKLNNLHVEKFGEYKLYTSTKTDGYSYIITGGKYYINQSLVGDVKDINYENGLFMSVSHSVICNSSSIVDIRKLREYSGCFSLIGYTNNKIYLVDFRNIWTDPIFTPPTVITVDLRKNIISWYKFPHPKSQYISNCENNYWSHLLQSNGNIILSSIGEKCRLKLSVRLTDMAGKYYLFK